MRIINGKYGGRAFSLNVSSQTRPTSNFAKEALFNILKNKVDFSEVYALDLFAGIGSIGFELASLEVIKVTMVDESKVAIDTLKKISQTLKAENIKIEKSDVFSFLEKQTTPYHVIFADPPYDFQYNEKLIATIFDKKILLAEGIFILEHYKKTSFANNPYFTEVRNYGDASFSFFKNKKNE